jgi:uncharacterized protein (DUF608 family)
LNNGTSRRDFVKAAVAASLTGVAASAQQPAQNPDPYAPSGSHSASPHHTQQHPAEHPEKIEFPRVFTGRRLNRISCPLGGIGTGGIGLGGRGNLQDWQIFNRPDTGNNQELTLPSLWVQTEGASPYSVVLERRYLPPYDTGENGFWPGAVPGLPRLAEAKFFSSFPLARIEFEDRDCPVNIALEAFSPFQPLDADASGLPCAVLTYEIHNPSAATADVAVAWSLSNPVGKSAARKNGPRSAPGIAGLFMTNPSLAADDPLQGGFALAALPPTGISANVLPNWTGADQNAATQHFWFSEFAQTGNLGTPQKPSWPIGSVSIRQRIPAGATRSFRFLLTWHFPNRTPERCGWDAPAGKEKTVIGNYYCTRFPDAWAVAEHVSANLPELERRTRAFVAALKGSTLPDAVKDAATANLSTLVSNTAFRIADGSFHGFEGCGDKTGLGFGSCTHVWNYEMVTQFLFPSLARSMRETSFGYATDDEGHMDFRHKLPLGFEHWGAAAADGQMGQIVKLYFDWTLNGDDEWLRRQWPAAKRALAYAWRPGGWDESKSGVMDGVQHNTYDVEFYGPNSMCSSWYLAALRAVERMANAMGDQDLAGDCHRMCDQGSQWIDAHLFNGEYYIQQIRGVPEDKIATRSLQGYGSKDTVHPQFQIGGGCFVDQLIGQHVAAVAGLGNLLDPAHVRKTLASIHRYNYKPSLARHAMLQRVYALNDEPGVVVCDYTQGARPDMPLFYFSEVWTGLEYSVAILMMTHGMIDEGIQYVHNSRSRYDGENRNPYDESEYGRHYTRPMASWAAIPVLSGFRYDARTHRMDLLPRLKTAAFQCFWSTPGAWGSFSLTAHALTLTPVVGLVSLKQLTIPSSLNNSLRNLKVTSAGKEIAHTASPSDDGILLQFSSPLDVDSTRPLRVQS